MNIIDVIEKNIAELEAQKIAIQKQCCHPEAALDKSIHNPYRDPLEAITYQYYCGLCHKKWKS